MYKKIKNLILKADKEISAYCYVTNEMQIYIEYKYNASLFASIFNNKTGKKAIATIYAHNTNEKVIELAKLCESIL